MSIDRQLESDLDWRLAELASLKKGVRAASTRVHERALLRSLWVLLYAHFEGFCVFAWDAYVSHIESLSIPRVDLDDVVARFSMEQACRRVRGDLSTDMLWRFASRSFHDDLQGVARFDVRLESEANLRAGLLETNCAKLNIVLSTLPENRVRVNTLVSRRNEIAHGRPNFVHSLSEYEGYERAAIEVMYELAITISEYVENEEFRQVVYAG